MRPAFSSTKSASAFALLALALLVSPLLAGKNLLPSREEIYSSTPVRYGPFQCLDKEIFHDHGDVDIAFVGSSRVLHGVDTPYVQAELSRRLGHPAEVVTFPWSWAGEDALYFIVRDLLEKRRVKLLVFTEESREGDKPHHAAPHFFRWAEDSGALDGLPFRSRSQYYFAAILGIPRNLLSLLRPNHRDLEPVTANIWNQNFHADGPMPTRGSVLARMGFRATSAQPAFSDFVPANGVTAADVLVYSPATETNFQFARSTDMPLQLHFVRELGRLAAEHHTRLVCLHLPQTTEMRSHTVNEVYFWPQALDAPVTMLGVPPTKLFSGLSDAEVEKLFLDPYHFNKNGTEWHTRLITPALLQIYDAPTDR